MNSAPTREASRRVSRNRSLVKEVTFRVRKPVEAGCAPPSSGRSASHDCWEACASVCLPRRLSWARCCAAFPAGVLKYLVKRFPQHPRGVGISKLCASGFDLPVVHRDLGGPKLTRVSPEHRQGGSAAATLTGVPGLLARSVELRTDHERVVLDAEDFHFLAVRPATNLLEDLKACGPCAPDQACRSAQHGASTRKAAVGGLVP